MRHRPTPALTAAVLLLLLAASPGPVRAQEVVLRGSAGIFVDTRHVRMVTPSPAFPSVDLKVGWRFPKGGVMSGGYGDPVIGVGAGYSALGSLEFPYAGRLGDAFSLYGHFRRPFVRRGAFSASYQLELGGSYLSHPYDWAGNSVNILYSASLEYYLGGGLEAALDLGEGWGLGAEVGLRHHSSGSLAVPNMGVTAVALALGARYSFPDRRPLPDWEDPSPGREQGTVLYKPFRWGVFLGGGLHQCDEERKSLRLLNYNAPARPAQPYWFKGSVGAEALWSYGGRFASGVGAELFYLPLVDILPGVDEALAGRRADSYSRFSVGVEAMQEIYYHNVAIHGVIGAYVFRRVGISEDYSRFYEKLGLRYYAPFLRGGFAGFHIMLHGFTMSDYMEITIGKHF